MNDQEFPQSVAEEFIEAWNRHDADGIADVFVADADFVNVVGQRWRDRERIRAAHDYGFRKIFGAGHRKREGGVVDLKVR